MFLEVFSVVVARRKPSVVAVAVEEMTLCIFNLVMLTMYGIARQTSRGRMLQIMREPCDRTTEKDLFQARGREVRSTSVEENGSLPAVQVPSCSQRPCSEDASVLENGGPDGEVKISRKKI